MTSGFLLGTPRRELPEIKEISLCPPRGKRGERNVGAQYRNMTTRYATPKLTIRAKDIVDTCMSAERDSDAEGSSLGGVDQNLIRRSAADPRPRHAHIFFSSVDFSSDLARF
ncbi:hypothetical protein [Mesorhizobium sp. WSM2239]|uniref:Uncharacterized protein n=2 Tax=unclassified Mesorhizobium TaxID=325217 RepID=A0AAU8D8L9_9HYPH